MRRLVVLNVAGLSHHLIGAATPNIMCLAARTSLRKLLPVIPAVTCPVQSSMLTGLAPDGHGIVGNGWYFRELGEVLLWRQSNRLVGGDRIWDIARRCDPAFTCANLFWWYAMFASTDVAVTPRPNYLADGRKVPDCWTSPPALREELTRQLGQFPLFKFWGPAADITSSQWIADAALHVIRTYGPTLTLIYLPHLDYVLQREGPNGVSVSRELIAVDQVCGEIIDECARIGATVLLVAEYAVGAVSRPVHVNRALRRAGWLRVREELGREQLDFANSDAFAVSDHQIAHVYVSRPELVGEVAVYLAQLPGVAQVLDKGGKRAMRIDHPRSGELVALADADAWFTWYHWLDDARAPDFARTVEIHRKPGYDPAELFMNPAFRWPRAAITWRMAKRAVGFRTLLDVIPLDSELVRGSHGVICDDLPVLIGADPALLPDGVVAMTALQDLMLRHLFPASGG